MLISKPPAFDSARPSHPWTNMSVAVPPHPGGNELLQPLTPGQLPSWARKALHQSPLAPSDELPMISHWFTYLALGQRHTSRFFTYSSKITGHFRYGFGLD